MVHETDWMPGDMDYAVKLKAHVVGGHVSGYYVYLTREHVARALKVPEADLPTELYATRTSLDPGTGQILVRLKKVRK